MSDQKKKVVDTKPNEKFKELDKTVVPVRN